MPSAPTMSRSSTMKADGTGMGYGRGEGVRRTTKPSISSWTNQTRPALQTTSSYAGGQAWAEEQGSSAGKRRKGRTARPICAVKWTRAGRRRAVLRQAALVGQEGHNLTESSSPIQSDATRVAALLSGEVDMVYPVPQQDVARVMSTGKHQVLTGFELRTIFVNMDQKRDELLESSVKGKNPFKDRRVRQAVYRAIDMQAIRDRIMGGTSHIAGIMVAPGINGYDAKLDTRLPYDPEASKKL
jgi:peptide/nickel transport system substrate-binding protein